MIFYLFTFLLLTYLLTCYEHFYLQFTFYINEYFSSITNLQYSENNVLQSYTSYTHHYLHQYLLT